jgi:hypothetical protein
MAAGARERLALPPIRWSCAMPDYRLYFLANDHIRRFVEFDCPDDEAAIEKVAEHADGRVMELWQRNRLVKRFEPNAT